MKSGQDKRGKVSIYSMLDTVSYLLVLLATSSFMLSSIALIPTPIGVVTSPSMEPLMTMGDIVFIKPAAINDIKVGDIIAYYSPPDRTVIHRVVSIVQLPGKIYLTTKGDANPVTDQSIGFPLVSDKNLIGEVFCLDGVPVKIPFIGRYMIDARNFAIWLTQNKIWSFWGPLIVMVYVFSPYLSPKGISQFDLRKTLRTHIPVKKLFTYALISFVGISAFTFYFKTETYSLSMRVAALSPDKEPAYISFGSMIYEEVRNNTIEVSGAPMFPVKTVAIVLGNASDLVSPIPRTMRVEPQERTELILQAKIPARGQVEPGIYRANVHIFSDSLLLLLPDSVIFSVLYVLRDPWISLILLDILAASGLSLLVSLLAMAINYISEQILYTIVWRDELESRPPHMLRIKFCSFKARVSSSIKRISKNMANFWAFMKRGAGLKQIWELTFTSTVLAAALLLFSENILLSVVALGTTLNILIWKFHSKSKEDMATSAAFGNLLLSIVFIIRHTIIILYSQVNILWCIISAFFVGIFSFMVTIPIVLIFTSALFFILQWAKIWYVIQQTINWCGPRTGVTTIKKRVNASSLGGYERLETRRSEIGNSRLPSGATIKLRNGVGQLHRLGKRISSVILTLRLGVHVAFFLFKEKETCFLEKEGHILSKFASFNKKLAKAKYDIAKFLSTAIWMIHWSASEVASRVRRGCRT